MSGKQIAVESQEAPAKPDLKAGPKNNICAYLDPTTRNAQRFADIINFLRRSRIYKAISTECPAYYSHQKDFWENVTYDQKESPAVMRSKVLGHDIVVTIENIRRVLEFGDSADCPVMLNKYLVRGCFLRVKYDGNLTKGVLTKSNLSPQYKYLAHVLQHCLSPRKAGHDEMRETIQCAFVALVLNIPFNFSAMTFHHMTENITMKKDMFLMYARFLQMIINDQAPNLPKSDDEVIPLAHMTDLTMNRLLSYKSREAKPPVKRLIGHLVNPDYVAPGGKKWRHDESDSDRENLLVPDDSDDDNDDQDCGNSAVPTTFTTVSASDTPDVVQSGETQESLRDEPVEVEAENEGGSSSARKKRIRGKESSTRTLAEVLAGKPKKKKKFTMLPLPGFTAPPSASITTVTSSGVQPSTLSPQTQHLQTQAPIFTSATAPTMSADATSSIIAVPVPDQMNMLNSLVIKLMADHQTLVTRLEEQAEQMRSRDIVIERLSKQVAEQASQINNQQTLLLTASNQNQQLALTVDKQAAQIKALEDSSKEFNSRLLVEDDGTLRIKGKEDSDNDKEADVVDSSDDEESVEKEAGASGSKPQEG